MLELGVVATGSIDGFGDILEYEVEIHFVFLGRRETAQYRNRTSSKHIPCHHLSRKRL